jgi:hypothetical protein
MLYGLEQPTTSAVWCCWSTMTSKVGKHMDIRPSTTKESAITASVKGPREFYIAA